MQCVNTVDSDPDPDRQNAAQTRSPTSNLHQRRRHRSPRDSKPRAPTRRTVAIVGLRVVDSPRDAARTTTPSANEDERCRAEHRVRRQGRTQQGPGPPGTRGKRQAESGVACAQTDTVFSSATRAHTRPDAVNRGAYGGCCRLSSTSGTISSNCRL